MSQKNDIVEEAIAAAKSLRDNNVAAQLPKPIVGEMVAINPVVPQMFDDEGRPYPKKEIQRQVDEYCSEQKKAILTHSISLAMGVDMSPGLAFETQALAGWLKQLGYNVKREDGDFTVVVTIPGGEYKITDTDRYCAGLRAIHFALTRHDPDTDEYVQRRLFSEMQAADKPRATAAEANPTTH
jgi:hypothetical protein